jgi:hypothetical protein
MAERLSDVIGVQRADLQREGAFDGFSDIDAPFHIDPHLLRTARTPELRQSHNHLTDYFVRIIKLLEASQTTNDRFYREVVRLLQFPELKNLRLGYSLSSATGRGIGRDLGAAIAVTAKELVNAGIKDPEIFELVGLLEEGVGADRISDMTIRIILPDLLAFSARVASNLKTKTRPVKCRGQEYAVPVPAQGHTPLILVPQEILRHLPVALDWSDIDLVCTYNDSLRARVNALIGKTWREARQKHSKREIRAAVLEHPGLMKELIALYTAKKGMHYDFARDPEGLLAWADIATRFAGQFPLAFAVARPTSDRDVLECVKTICNQFALLIENNGLNELLYDGAKLKHERFAQLLFYGIADAYCAANNLDLSREPNAGRGPVDFKVSRGYQAKVTVEVKYSSNPATARGFSEQLPEYNKAERTTHSVYLILRTTLSTGAIDSVLTASSLAKRLGNRSPEVVVVDARRKPSASKQKAAPQQSGRTLRR